MNLLSLFVVLGSLWSPALVATLTHSASSASPPVVTNVVKPTYPSIAAAKKINGTVLVDVEIDACGVVREAKSVSGPTLLRKAAKEAAMRWRFNHDEAGSQVRSARLIFIFRPVSYKSKESEIDFTPPYQIAVSWTAASVRPQVE